MLRVLLLVNLLLLVFELSGQNILSIQGSIKDSTGQPVIGANIRIITTRNDSLHTITNERGDFYFSINNRIPFKITVRSLGFNTSNTFFAPKSVDTVMKLPPIFLSANYKQLNEVIIKSKRSPISLKSDTIEFLTNHYQLRENAKVEDLLKRLPGLQVEYDGTLTFMGNKISKVRINGKDFPINDIQSLFQLLSANLLEKIQLLNDYGDLAKLTGRKSGTPEMVINLETSAKVKRNIQLKGIVGTNTEGRYTEDVMGILMDEKRQLLLSENANNINPNVTQTEQSKANVSYNDQLNERLDIRMNPFVEHVDNLMQSYSAVTTLTNAGNIFTSNNSKMRTSNKNYSIIGGADYTSLNGIKILSNFRGALVNQDNLSVSDNVQSGIQHLTQMLSAGDKGKLSTFFGSVVGSKNFKKSKTILSIGINSGIIRNNHTESINNHILYFESDDTMIKDSTLSQIIDDKSDFFTISPQISLTKEIDSLRNIECHYVIEINRSNNSFFTKWPDSNNKYIIVDSLSNEFNYVNSLHAIGGSYKAIKKRVNYELGGNLNFFQYYKKKGISVSPNFIIGYNLNKSAYLSFRYGVMVIFPTYQQIQPVSNLSNPLLPTIGNPNINASYNHTIALDYRHVGISTLFMSFGASALQNKIVTNIVSVEDSYGGIKQETHYLNTDGNYSINGNYGWINSFIGGKLQLSLDGIATLGKNIFYTDYIRHISRNLMFGQSVKMSYFMKWLEGSAMVSYSFNRNTFDSQLTGNTTIHKGNLIIDSKLYIAQTLFFSLTINKQINNGYMGTIHANPIILNAAIEKNMLKNRFTIKLQGFNLLNEQKSVIQTVSSNSISETSNTLLGRYVLLSAQFDLKKTKNKN